MTLAPNDSNLLKLHIKFQQKYKEELEAVEEKFIKNKKEEFKKLLDAENYPILLQEIDDLEAENIGNKTISPS